MKLFLQYLKHPTIERSSRPIDIIVGVVLYFLIPPIVSIALFSLFDHLPMEPASGTLRPSQPNVIGLVVSILLEEVAFRLPLKNTLVNRVLSSLALSLLLVRLFFISICPTVVMCVAVLLFIASLLFVLQSMMYRHLSFHIMFYIFAFAFGLLHIVRIDFSVVCLSSILYGFFYCLDKIVGGIILGYLRIQVNLLFVITLHLVYDLLPFAMELFVNFLSR